MKQLPNVISCTRIVLSVMLLFLLDRPVLFAVLYLLCGLSDLLDGYLARLLTAETALGSKLDSLGDFIFYAVWLFILSTLIKSEDKGQIMICVIIVAIIRIANLVITKIKFKQWSIMHTMGNKLTGLALFFLLPVYIYVNNVPFWSWAAFSAIAALSGLEESALLFKFNSYDPNRRSF